VSLPGLTGQSSIPGLWLLDRPVKPGDDSTQVGQPIEIRSDIHHGVIALPGLATIFPRHAGVALLSHSGPILPLRVERLRYGALAFFQFLQAENGGGLL